MPRRVSASSPLSPFPSLPPFSPFFSLSAVAAGPVSTGATLLLLGGLVPAVLGGMTASAPEASAAVSRPAEGSSRTAGAPRPADELTFSVSDSGAGRDGTYTLRCHPAGGEHAAPGKACAALDRATSQGRDPFAPVPSGATCTMVYGGPATARVTGTWHGRKVEARFARSNGCEVERWNSLVPALPRTA